ncbi:PH domain-containing protein [Nocardia puris]|uniref:PH (Pleckstrin Homology) domain-containing protein n=1 Tax=Nocardia puris TaxID=208602 RepID=A0A366E1C8_9NOCA|nr:PH domain-containing protein [Nocardia puris]MBF6209555.1 PH domain-containing protein [Nocardia puris]MBF6366127.1 PH domain-containing protein [Nocardia puris]MBF6458532.1 PH domain-containing protein [Nocardia puris]RBO96180.1 PH (Pleckstrin Homology) domain-containing protein [Nocardia puris]
MPVVRIWRRAETPEVAEEWDFEVRPRRARITASIVAVVLVIVFAIGGIWLRSGSTGVNFRFVDQFAMVGIGLLLAGGVLMLTRPRVRVGPRGVSVRNILGDNEFAWRNIVGVAFPDRKSWARLELTNDDYVPMLAIRSNDKEHAARAMDRLRELGAKYTGATDTNQRGS